jgi:hypothetical protein
MPDRPGALGAVASRVGAVGGDVVGIDIVDRGGGRAVDDLIVELPEAELLDLLAREVDEVDGVDVEEIHPTDTHGPPHRLALLDAALELVRACAPAELLAVLIERTQGDLAADWTAIVDVARPGVVDAVGELPDLEWLVAFASGASTSPQAAATGAGCDDVSWAVLTDGLVLVTGRNRATFRPSERAELCGLADIAAVRLAELDR